MAAGRPTEKTDEIIRKIEEVAALGGSIEEIAFFAGIHRATLYRWMNDDVELSDRITELQQNPILKARRTIVEGLADKDTAKWYLERKVKEFKPKSDITSDNKPIPLLGGQSNVSDYNSNEETTSSQ